MNKHFFYSLLKIFFRVNMILVVYFDIELCQMDIKTIFPNRYLDNEVYMVQSEGFTIDNSGEFWCRLKSLIHGL